MAKGKLPKHVFLDAEKRDIHLVGPISHQTCDLVEKAIAFFSRNSKKPARLLISSHGGDVGPSLRLFYAVSRAEVSIDTVALRHADSGAFLVLQAGRKRCALNGAKMRFHHCEHPVITGEWYNAQDHRYAAGELDKMDAMQLLIFTARSPFVDKIFQLFEEGAEITAKEAKKYGLIDKIIKKSRA